MEQLELLKVEDWERAEFMLAPQARTAVALTGNWPRVLETLWEEHTRDWQPRPKISLEAFKRVYTTAEWLRSRGWVVLYPEGTAPRLIVAQGFARTRPAPRATQRTEKVIITVEL